MSSNTPESATLSLITLNHIQNTFAKHLDCQGMIRSLGTHTHCFGHVVKIVLKVLVVVQAHATTNHKNTPNLDLLEGLAQAFELLWERDGKFTEMEHELSHMNVGLCVNERLEDPDVSQDS